MRYIWKIAYMLIFHITVCSEMGNLMNRHIVRLSARKPYIFVAFFGFVRLAEIRPLIRRDFTRFSGSKSVKAIEEAAKTS